MPLCCRAPPYSDDDTVLLVPVGGADSVLVPVGEADSVLVPVGEADSVL